MSTPHDPRSRHEQALLMRALETEAALSPTQIAFLRDRGFLPAVEEYHDPDYDDYDPRNDWGYVDPLDEAMDRLDAQGEVAGRSLRRAGAARADRGLAEWSLAQLGDHLAGIFENHSATVFPLLHLAPEADSFGSALTQVAQIDLDTLTERIDQGYTRGTFTFRSLWSIVALEAFRAPLPVREKQHPGGAVVQAYRALLRASDHQQLPGKYTWILRREEVALVPRFLAVQRRLLRASGQLWQADPSRVSRFLRQTPHAIGLLAHLLLHNSHPPGHPARTWAEPEESFESLSPASYPVAHRRAWTLAVQVAPDLLLPYLVESARGSETAGGLRCPRGWNELGYRMREDAP